MEPKSLTHNSMHRPPDAVFQPARGPLPNLTASILVLCTKQCQIVFQFPTKFNFFFGNVGKSSILPMSEYGGSHSKSVRHLCVQTAAWPAKNPLNLPVPLPKLDALLEKASTPKADKAVGPDRRSWPQRAAGLGLVEKPLGSVGPERRAERGSRCRAPQPGEMPVQDDAAVQRTGRLPPRRTHCVYT